MADHTEPHGEALVSARRRKGARKAEARAFLGISEGKAGQGGIDILGLAGLNHSSDMEHRSCLSSLVPGPG